MNKFVPLNLLSKYLIGKFPTFAFLFVTLTVAQVALAQTTTLNYTGTIVTYTVPDGVTKISIESFGAEGGGSLSTKIMGGKGARMKGEFVVTAGQQLKVLVGSKGGDGNEMGGGGGGTFVTNIDNTPLCIAGGGGGSYWGIYSANNDYSNGSIDNAGMNGTNGAYVIGGIGGINGNGGNVDNVNKNNGAAGAGLLTNGADAIEVYAGFPHANGGLSFMNGGAGGKAMNNGSSGDGGFGGGGASDADSRWTWGAGGGGGYSGGGGGSIYGCGGGGGSFNNGANQDNAGGVNVGDGKVVITILEKTDNTPVVDKEAPFITAPADITVECDAIPAADNVIATDNIDLAPSVSLVETRTEGTGNYIITRTWTATDASGNIATAKQLITVTDTKAPTLSAAPANISVECSAIPAAIDLTATDNCDASPVVVFSETITNGNSIRNYTITRLWTATDASGNSSSKSQIITVKDTKAPVADIAVLPAVITQGIATLIAPTATDLCGGTITGTLVNASNYFKPGTYTVTWKYDDLNGNISTQTQRVTFKDLYPPVPVVLNLPDLTAECSLFVTERPTAMDYKGVEVIATTYNSLSFSRQGIFKINWNYTDKYGNKSTQIQRVIIKDITPPVPSVTDLPIITGQCSATLKTMVMGVSTVVPPTATDNCAGLIKGTTRDPLTYTKQGTFIVNWTYTDAAGNKTVQTQTVIVKDDQKPIPLVAELPLITGESSVRVNMNYDGNNDKDDDPKYGSPVPYAMDNCSGLIKGKTNDPIIYKGIGPRTIHWYFDDKHGNITYQDQQVLVYDVTPPVLRVPANITVKCGGSRSTTLTGVATAKDNSVGVIDISYSDAINGNIITRTWKATDEAGNSSSANQTISVGSLFSINLKAVPNSSVYTGGVSTNLFLGYGAQAATLQMNSLPSVGAPYSFVWDGFGKSQLSNTTIASPVFRPTTAGVQTFTVTATNKYGCVATASISICVTDVRAATNKITICHAGINGAPAQTILVNTSEVATHLLTHPGDRLGSCNQSPCNSNTVYTVLPTSGPVELQMKNSIVESSTAVNDLTITVMPNPSATYFTIKLSSKNPLPVNMRVVDAAGRVIEGKQKLDPNSTIQIGHTYGSGIYFVEMIQGNTQKTIQLIKARG